ncbi:MAG: lamin tail domain-containing protein [Deltaproteobacteria bacterium]|nr:lamin tail domain-containing protein [Deltaproteobacteria bacterium]
MLTRFTNLRSSFRLIGPLSVLIVGILAGGCSGGGGGDDQCKASLLAGDLVITEIMANPDGTDEGKEWFELYNTTAAAIDLSGVKIEAAKTDGSTPKFHLIGVASIDPGQYLVLGGVLEVVKPDYVDYAYAADLGGMYNSGGQLSVYCGAALIDRVIYTEMNDGVANGFDGQLDPESIANDNFDDWCESKIEYDTDALGTPGTANEACEGDLPPTSCKENDQVRDVVAPLVGDLVISEFMPNPDLVDDAVGEWFEIYVARDVDLNGLQIGKSADGWEKQVASLECVPVTAGSYLLFARSDDPTENGGLPAVDLVFGFTLANTSGVLNLGYGGLLLDGITYSSSHTGASTALEASLTDPVQNDNEDYWCAGSAVYGNGDLGTPGAENTSCGISPDGKCYDAGVLVDVRKPVAGDLVITEFMANPTSTDTGKEWFEVYVATDVDLNLLQIGKTGGEVLAQLPSGDCLPVTAGSYIVLAASDDQLVNGGLPQVDFPLDFSLGNSDSGIFIGYEDLVLDQITYTSSASGASTALDPRLSDQDQNDNQGYWCEAKDAYGDGDLGTPGGANPSCNVAPEGQCYDNDVLRDLVLPTGEQLVITEFMANPDAAGDEFGEWFEVYVSADVDLNLLQMGDDPLNPDFRLPGGDCLRVSSGSYLVFARSAVADDNGNLPAVDFVFDFGLTNSSSSLFVGMNDSVLDQISWESTAVGKATSLDPDSQTTIANDELLNWCPAVDTYGDGDFGTPGVVNPDCL